MQQRVLVPIANPATTVRLVEFASNIKVDSDDPIFPISVISSYRSSAQLQERAEKVLEQANEHIHAAGSQSKPLIRRNLNVASGIARASSGHLGAATVVGWVGRGAPRVSVGGGIADQRLQGTPPQVFVCELNQPIAAHA